MAKVVSYGAAGSGPEKFMVWTKSGQVMEYGYSSTSRVEAIGSSSIRLWAMNRATDAASNYLVNAANECFGGMDFDWSADDIDGSIAMQGTGENRGGVTGDGAYEWLSGDLDGDGDIDLVRRSKTGTNNLTLLSDGDGSFTQKNTGESRGGISGDGTYQWLAGDLDGDGDIDLVRRSKPGTNNLTLLSDGDGTFTQANTGESRGGVSGDGT